MFGFTRLASYDYFAHVERALHARFEGAGQPLETHVSDVLPTASVRRRAAKLAELVARTAGSDGDVHLLGHSTGGLDARLVASPCAHLPVADGVMDWLPRLRSVTAMNTPHYGTPLASFFATSRGQQVLYALSAFTVIGLSLGARPLALVSLLIGVIGRGDRALGIAIPILDKRVDSLVALLDDVRHPDVRTYLKAIKEDQGSMMQLSPESMDLVVAGFEDRPGVRYQCTASMSPSPTPRGWVDTLGHPWRTLSLSLFFALHHITANTDPRYPCAALVDTAPSAGEVSEAELLRVFGRAPTLEDNDGVVPLRSQLWGNLIWAGLGDHLDVLGHYRDDSTLQEADPELRHRDWLTSGSAFRDGQFATLMDAIAKGMLA